MSTDDRILRELDMIERLSLRKNEDLSGLHMLISSLHERVKKERESEATQRKDRLVLVERCLSSSLMKFQRKSMEDVPEVRKEIVRAKGALMGKGMGLP